MSTVVHSNYVIDKYPTSCKECPFYHETAYKDNAYKGRQGGCLLGYMRHCDMREYNSSQLFDKCGVITTTSTPLSQCSVTTNFCWMFKTSITSEYRPTRPSHIWKAENFIRRHIDV